MKVNILGTDYFLEEKTAAEEPFLEDGDGFCDFTSKKIVVRKYTDSERRMHSNDIPEVARQEVIRHELTHAFLYESGMECFDDEAIVEWVARLFPKLFCTFVDAGAVTVTLDGATVVTCGLNAGQVNNLPGKGQNSKHDEFWRAGEDPVFLTSLCNYIKTACELHDGKALMAKPELNETIRQNLLCFANVLAGDYGKVSGRWCWSDAVNDLLKYNYTSEQVSASLHQVLQGLSKPSNLAQTFEDIAAAWEVLDNFDDQMQKVAEVVSKDNHDPAPNLDPENELAATVSMAVSALEDAKVLFEQCEWETTYSHRVCIIKENLGDAWRVARALKSKIDREVIKHD